MGLCELPREHHHGLRSALRLSVRRSGSVSLLREVRCKTDMNSCEEARVGTVAVSTGTLGLTQWPLKYLIRFSSDEICRNCHSLRADSDD